MKIASNKVLGVSMAAGALVASINLGAHPTVIDIQAAPATPVHVSAPPPSPSPNPPPPPNYDPRQDYWTGQGRGGGAPGGAGGAGGAGGGG